MKHEMPVSPVSFVATVARLPQKGLPVVIEADEKQRAALAEEHGLETVERYRAELLITAWKRNGIKVSGTVEADIVQACVVTLEPIETHVSEEVSGLFLPEDSKLARHGFGEGGEIMLDADGPDSPELFSGETIDVGALAEEFFGLAIDPYPRKKGAELRQPSHNLAEEPVENELQRKLRALTQKR
ncbi:MULTISPECIES: YceD family protein [unclassified Mesorhizobium]|uniref:YceD family protein n=1 Tax=unclassified Mesorhizobium TaxID=325217 RepID=UPI0030142AB8